MIPPRGPALNPLTAAFLWLGRTHVSLVSVLSTPEVPVMRTLSSCCLRHTSPATSLSFLRVDRCPWLLPFASLALLCSPLSPQAAEPKTAKTSQSFVLKTTGSLLLVGYLASERLPLC